MSIKGRPGEAWASLIDFIILVLVDSRLIPLGASRYDFGEAIRENFRGNCVKGDRKRRGLPWGRQQNGRDVLEMRQPRIEWRGREGGGTQVGGRKGGCL